MSGNARSEQAAAERGDTWSVATHNDGHARRVSALGVNVAVAKAVLAMAARRPIGSLG